MASQEKESTVTTDAESDAENDLNITISDDEESTTKLTQKSHEKVRPITFH
jgi:hypothetical protein